MADTETRMARILLDHLGVDIAIREDPMAAKLIDDLGADSIDIVELTMAFEDEFQVEIYDDEVDRLFDTGRYGAVRDWCGLIESKLPVGAKA